jgi:hypothetical protein
MCVYEQRLVPRRAEHVAVVPAQMLLSTWVNLTVILLLSLNYVGFVKWKTLQTPCPVL